MDYVSDVVDVPIETVEEFRSLSNRWKRETKRTSSIHDLVMHDAYQAIIGLGSPAVLLILRDLESQPSHWFWALRTLTQEWPVKPEDEGDVPAMTGSWLAWGREKGYLANRPFIPRGNS